MPVELLQLGPVDQLRAGQLTRRLPQLLLGLWIYGVSIALMVRSHLGTAPWDVLNLGVAKHAPIDIGQATIVISFIVLIGWLPLRELPGIGTLLNAVLIGISADVTLAFLDAPSSLWTRVAFVIGGVALNGGATAMYIGAQLGRGPRDGLMTGLARRTGHSIRLVRTCLEVAVVIVGLALGGPLGLGTVLYVLSIGPLTQLLLPWFLVRLTSPDAHLVTLDPLPEAY